MSVKRYEIITEADARQMDTGATVELAAGGHVTPLARDTLAARRVTVIPAGTFDPALPSDLAPAADVRRVAIGSDHTGIELRKALVVHLRGRGLAVSQFGPDAAAIPVDYPDVAAEVARAVANGRADAGVVIDGSGIGSAIAANKVPGIRAAMCPDERFARYAREHNGAHVVTLGSTVLPGPDAAIGIVNVFLTTPMREARYVRRLLKIRRLEEQAARER